MEKAGGSAHTTDLDIASIHRYHRLSSSFQLSERQEFVQDGRRILRGSAGWNLCCQRILHANAIGVHQGSGAYNVFFGAVGSVSVMLGRFSGQGDRRDESCGGE